MKREDQQQIRKLIEVLGGQTDRRKVEMLAAELERSLKRKRFGDPLSSLGRADYPTHSKAAKPKS
jgi:hypothetical protein